MYCSKYKWSKLLILSHDRCVTLDRSWICWIYCTLEHITRDYYLQITITEGLVYSVMVFTALLRAASNSSQQLNPISPLTDLYLVFIIISWNRTRRKHHVLSCRGIVAYWWHDVFNSCIRNHQYGLCREHHSSSVIYVAA